MKDSEDLLAREVSRLCARVAELERERTEWEETERRLKASCARLAGILEIAPDAIISIDSDQKIRLFNQGAERIFGYKAAEVIGRDLDLLIPESFRGVHRHHVEDFHRSDQSARLMGERPDVRARRKDGTEFPAEASLSKLIDPEFGVALTVILRDITERVRTAEELRVSREELRKLAARLDSAKEDESKRIAREVHDELGQSLTVVKMRLAAIAREAGPRDGPLGKAVEELIGLVAGTMETVKRIATELRPSLLDQLGLEAAMEAYLAEFQKNTGIEGTAEFNEGSLRGNSRLSIVLFRIFQEALTNVARHSGATRVKVKLRQRSDLSPVIQLEIEDNGQGFDVHRTGDDCLGLLGMRERALNLGGDVLIDSRPGEGTRVTVCIPLSE